VHRRWRWSPSDGIRTLVGIGPHLLLLPGAGLPGERRSRSSKRLTTLLIRVGWLRRRVDIRQPLPAISSRARRRSRRRLSLLRTGAGPLGSWRPNCSRVLVGLRVHIGGHWGASGLDTASRTIPQELEPGLDVRIAGV